MKDKDYRTPIAKVRDAWLESAEGQKMQDGTAFGKYLKNRLEVAFLAGLSAGLEMSKDLPKGQQ